MLNPTLDIDTLAREFQQKKRIQIADVLVPDIAERLHHCLENEVPWGVTYVGIDGKPHLLTSDQLLNQSKEDWAALHAKVLSQAPNTYQFLYNSYMMITAYKERRDLNLPLHAVVEFLNSNTFLEFVRRITGLSDVIKTNAQATRYIPGCFLMKHNDVNETNTRKIAYVINLTKDWQADWGGLLQFLDAAGRVEETHFPVFNSLALFQVPMWHEVSYVVPYAAKVRYAITGWVLSR